MCSDDEDCELLMSESLDSTSVESVTLCCSAFIEEMKSVCDDVTVSPDELEGKMFAI